MNAPEKKPQPRWTRRKDARPEEIIAAALDLFVERGFAATRLDDVAARAGVSKGTLYLYFENKEDLFKAVVRGNMLPLLQHGEALVENFTGSSGELMRRLVRGWWNLTGSTKATGLPKLVISEAGNFPDLAEFYYREVILRAHSMFRKVLQRGTEAGEFRAVDIDHLVHVSLAPLVMLTLWSHSFACCEREQLQPERYLDTYLDTLLHGLLKPQAQEKKHARKKP
ncbi:MAG: TetR/AcrR family transcriptional regulator [Betaproteobacteria bacterium]|nr:MAG: TetR/AcrR family transcriptional regulator [Betaproteobacteria bacterium]